MTQSSEKTVPVSCNKDCGAGCALLAHVNNGRIEKITDNPLIDEPAQYPFRKNRDKVRGLYGNCL